MATPAGPAIPTVAIFASERGPGDPERANLMSQAGTLLARRGARLVCLAEYEGIPIPLVTAARAAGGDVLIVADDSFVAPRSLADVPCERLPGPEARLFRVASLANLFVGLPGSLASARSLYQAWAKAGGGSGGKPVVLLNRNRAFEGVRGLYADVFSHSVKKPDRYVQFTDSVEDLWNKVSWLLGEAPQR